MYSTPNLPLHILAVLVVAAVAATILASQATAQQSEQPEQPDPLELYDANDNGVIDAEELVQATSDYLNGLIDRELALRVWELYESTGGDAQEETVSGKVCPYLAGPTGLTLTSTHDQIDASWDLVSNPYPHFVVSYTAIATGPSGSTSTKTTGSGSASFTGLTKSTTYTVSVTTNLIGLPLTTTNAWEARRLQRLPPRKFPLLPILIQRRCPTSPVRCRSRRHPPGSARA